MSNKDLIDLEAMSPRERAFYESLPEHEKPLFFGYGKFKRKDFDVPEFNRALWEKVYENGNAFITLGLDRPGMPDTGFGGKRASRCATIDLVAGRMGHRARKRDANTGEIKEWDNNFVVTRWTGEASKIFGWSADEIIGKPIMNLHIIYEVAW